MNLIDITQAANAFADEDYDSSLIRHYVNTAIGIINSRLKAKLPFITSGVDDYDALDDSWIMSLLVPYAAYGIKMNDGSLNEAENYLMAFESAMRDLEESKLTAISEEYREPGFDGVYKADLSRGINIGWFGRRR